MVFKNTLTIIGDMGLLYKITKWGVNRLIKQGVDLSNLVDVDKTTKLLREASLSLNNDLVNIQDQFCVKRSEIIKAQNELRQFQNTLKNTTDVGTIKTLNEKLLNNWRKQRCWGTNCKRIIRKR